MSESEIAQMMGYRGGGQTRRFMTGMGPVELAAGGLADAPVNPSDDAGNPSRNGSC